MGLISRVSSRTYRNSNHGRIRRHPTTNLQKTSLRPRWSLQSRNGRIFHPELAEDGYSGLIVRKSKTCEVIIIATRPSQVLGEKTRRIRELTAIVNKRWSHGQGQIDLY